MQLARRAVESRLFSGFITTVILLNVLVLALYHANMSASFQRQAGGMMSPPAGLRAASRPVLASCCQHPVLTCILFKAVLPHEPLPSLCSQMLSALRSANGVWARLYASAFHPSDVSECAS